MKMSLFATIPPERVKKEPLFAFFDIIFADYSLLNHYYVTCFSTRLFSSAAACHCLLFSEKSKVNEAGRYSRRKRSST